LLQLTHKNGGFFVRQLVPLLLCAAMLGASIVPAYARTPRTAAHPRLDLADTVQGTYFGDIVSDSRWSSHSGVTITVTKTAPNTVQVSSSYSRLPSFAVRLTRAMQTIQQASGGNVFLLEQSKSPWSLGVTVDGASWWGAKR
jgi:hypothetical protein